MSSPCATSDSSREVGREVEIRSKVESNRIRTKGNKTEKRNQMSIQNKEVEFCFCIFEEGDHWGHENV